MKRSSGNIKHYRGLLSVLTSWAHIDNKTFWRNNFVWLFSSVRFSLLTSWAHIDNKAFWRNIGPVLKFLSFHSVKPFFMQNISAFLSAWQIVAWGVSCWIFCVLPRHIKNFLFLHELNFRLTFSLGFKDRVGPWSIYKRWRVRFFKDMDKRKKTWPKCWRILRLGT